MEYISASGPSERTLGEILTPESKCIITESSGWAINTVQIETKMKVPRTIWENLKFKFKNTRNEKRGTFYFSYVPNYTALSK